MYRVWWASAAPRWTFLVLSLVFGTIARSAPLDLSRVVEFHIEEQPLTSALLLFSSQSHIQLTSPGNELGGMMGHAVIGRMPIDAAIKQLLLGTGFTYRPTDDASIVVVKEAATSRRITTDVPPPAGDARATPFSGVGLEEIVVTANRREQSSRDVPMSISALSSAALDNLGIRNFTDVARKVPGLTLSPGWAGSTNISIRGISSLIGAGTTGVYIDDVPIQVRFVGAGTTSTNAYPAVFDLDRVEVLRGPQGTLFGAGSEGGTIRFITPDPSLSHYTGYARTEFASTEDGAPSYEGGAAYGGPIVDNVLGFRISAYARHDGGWLDRADYQTGHVTENDSNWMRTIVVHGALAYKPIDDLKLTTSVYYQDVARNDLSSYWTSLSDPAANVFRTGQPLKQPGSDHFILPSLKVQWDVGAASLISNTSYLNRRNPSTADYSNYLPELLGADYTVPGATGFTSPAQMLNTQQEFTQEIRLQSNLPGSRFTWVLGAFFQHSKQGAVETIYSPLLDEVTNALYGGTTAAVLGVPLGANGLSYLGVDSTVDQQSAAFGQVDFKVLPELTATVGVRVAKTKFSYTNSQQGALNGGSTMSSGSQSQTPVTPKYGLSYKPNSDWLIYATAAKGFREGGANTTVNASRCASDLAALGLAQVPSKYDADTVWSYEVGTKGRLFEGRVQLQGSVFYIPWSDTQEVVPLLSCGFHYISNVGSASSRGFDFQFDWHIVAGLSLSSSVAYTHAKYTQTALGGVLPQGGRAVIVANGDPLSVAPWQFSSNAEYSVPVGDDRSAYLRLSVDYSAGYYSSVNPLSATYDPAVTRQDSARFSTLRTGARTAAWDVSLFCNNLFNSHSVLATTHDTLASTLFRQDTYRPRTVGLNASYNW